jgi:hypothetical protein
MKTIFCDCEILKLENDKEFPGVLIKARKSKEFNEKDLSNYELYNIIVGKRINKVTDKDFRNFHFFKISLIEKSRIFKNNILEKSLKIFIK